MKINRYNIIFIGLILFHLSVLLLLISSFSISYKEALVYFEDTGSILHIITNISTYIFGQNDFALRIPFILFYIGSAVLMYFITKGYFKSERDRLINLSIFMILPGVNSAALLVHESIIVIFFTLLYIYLYRIKNTVCYTLLVLLLFIDNSFAILFLGLLFYSLKIKDNILLALSLLLFGVSMTMYGFNVGGVPQGYFLDTFGKYATIFSPVLFVYFFYAIYRIGLKMEKDIFWYISATALFFSLILSLRQHIRIEDFAPFVVISMPIMVKLFIHSLRVRLKEFRTIHYLIARVTIFVLVANFAIFVFNQYLYVFMKNPENHFAYKYHVAKDLAYELKRINITEVLIDDKELSKRLEFYNITSGDKYFLNRKKQTNHFKTIEVKYYNKVITTFYIEKI